MKRRLFLASLLPMPALAFPERTITVVVPFAAGGSTDIAARLIAERLAALTGARFVVENRTGAGGAIGSEAVKRAAPDGRTLYLTNGNGPPGSTGRLLRSEDAGHHWHEITLPGMLNSTIWCVAMHPADPQLLFTCTNLGQVFRSTDGGTNWTRLPREFGEIRALHWRPAAPANDSSAVAAQWTYR